MTDNRGLSRKRSQIYILLLFIILLYSNLFIYKSIAGKKNISGFRTNDIIQPNEQISYHFYNNITFEISTDILIDLDIEYDNNIGNRQTSFLINNSNPIELSIEVKSSIQHFGLSQSPQHPKKGGFKFQYGFNCIYRIQANTSIDKLTIRYRKVLHYGIEPEKTYSMALLASDQDSWEIIDTVEDANESSSEKYLESTLLDIDATTGYYITLYEINVVQDDWTWLITTILVISVSLIAIVVLISKKDYFQYLRTRTIPIEKGAHRLSLDDVLENENRNKIIDLILNEPGIHFNELLRKTGIAAGNLVWHIDILITYKVIGKKRIGNFIAYFPYYQKNPLSNIDLKLQKSRLTLEVLEMIERDPGIWNNIITKKLKVDHKTIHYHINKLLELDLLNIKKEGRKNKLYPNFESEYFKFKINNKKE